MMNIVHIEGVLFGLRKAKETYKNTTSYYKYDILILNEDTKLATLTGNQPPELLLQEMVLF
ncbi:MAG: hypothetical protein ACOH1N_00540 [Lutibacter sp.]